MKIQTEIGNSGAIARRRRAWKKTKSALFWIFALPLALRQHWQTKAYREGGRREREALLEFLTDLEKKVGARVWKKAIRMVRDTARTRHNRITALEDEEKEKDVFVGEVDSEDLKRALGGAEE